MPELGTWAWFSWLAAILFQTELTWALYRRRKQFRALFSYLCAKSLTSLTLLGIVLSGDGDAQNWLYFYVYYLGAIASATFGYAIISQIATSFVDSAEMRIVIGIALRYMAGAFILGSFVFSLLSPQPFRDYDLPVNLAVHLNRAVCLASVLVFLGCLYAARWLKMAWPAKIRGIAFGYALVVIGDMGFWLVGIKDKQILGCAQQVLWLACLSTWTITLRSAARPFPVERLCPAPTLEA